jgi:hypothetical protein
MIEWPRANARLVRYIIHRSGGNPRLVLDGAIHLPQSSYHGFTDPSQFINRPLWPSRVALSTTFSKCTATSSGLFNALGPVVSARIFSSFATPSRAIR